MLHKVLFLAAMSACWAVTATTASGAPAPSAPEQVTVSLKGKAKPGTVKVGDTVMFTITAKGPVKYELSLLIPDGSAPLHPSQPLRDEAASPNVWSPRSGKLQKLTFGAVLSSPPGAKGKGLWCLTVMVAPSFDTKSPPAWTTGQLYCYRLKAENQGTGA